MQIIPECVMELCLMFYLTPTLFTICSMNENLSITFDCNYNKLVGCVRCANCVICMMCATL